MADPKRLIDTAAPDVQSLLREGKESFGPPPGARDAVWLGVSEQIAPPPPSTSPPRSVAKAGAQAKLAAWVGLAAMGGFVALRSLAERPTTEPTPTPVVAHETPVTLQTTEPRVREEESLSAPALTPPLPSAPLIAPSVVARNTSVPMQSAAPLNVPSGETTQVPTPEEEAAVVREARAAIRRGDAAGALTILSGYERTYRGGALTQERDFLRIEALRANHDPHAQAMIERFLRNYPDSPYRSRLVPHPVP